LGGGLFSAANATVMQCTFASNSVTGGTGGTSDGMDNGGVAEGAGTYNSGTMVLWGCTVAANTSTGGLGGADFIVEEGYPGGAACGGGIFNGGNKLAAINCTVANNLSVGGPGAYGSDGANGYGGGIYGSTNGPTALTNCSFSGNVALGGSGTGGGTNGLGYGGDLAQAGVLELIDTIVAAGVSNNAYGSLTDLGYNISSDSSCDFSAPGSRNNVNPMLQPLANNGGPTETMALTAGSPAIDAGISLPGITTDQRGYPRPSGPTTDIGAFEFQSVTQGGFLTLESSTGGVLRIRFTSPYAGQTFRTLASSNLLNWNPIATNTIGRSNYGDLSIPITNGISQFFRTVVP